MNDAQRPAGRRLRRASTASSRPRSSSGCARRPAASTRHELVFCSRSGPPQVPWLEPDVNDHLEDAGQGRRAGRGVVPDRLRLRPHGGRLRPRHRGAGDRRDARPAGQPGGDRRDRPALRRRWCATCCVERAAAERGEEVAAGRGRRPDGRCRDLCAAGCCPNPRGERPALGGAALPSCHVTAATRADELLDLALDGGPREAAALVRERRTAAGSRSPTPSPATSTSSPRPTASSEELIRAGCSTRAPRRRVPRARRATTRRAPRGVRWIVDPIDGTVNYLYGLPQYAVSIAAERRRRGGGRRGAQRRRPGVEYAATRAARRRRDGVPLAGPRAAPPLRAAAGRHRLRLRRRRARRPGRGGAPGCCRRSATSAGSARARWTCATSPRAARTRYVEEGVQPLGPRGRRR